MTPLTMPLPALRAMLAYDGETGDLRWLEREAASFYGKEAYRAGVTARWNRERAGRVAGCISPDGYRVLTIAKRTFKAHRIAWALFYGKWPDGQLDHKNHDRADNRIANLREVTASENSRNRSLPRHNQSGVIGVSLDAGAGRWRAAIFHAGRKIELGYFENVAEAAAARAAANIDLGYHPNHGATK